MSEGEIYSWLCHPWRKVKARERVIPWSSGLEVGLRAVDPLSPKTENQQQQQQQQQSNYNSSQK